MATVEHSRTKRRADSTRQESKKGQAAKPRRFHFFRWLLLASLLALVYFAPVIVANTPLRPWVVQSVLRLDGTVSMDSVSLGWFSPVIVENLEICDSAGDVILQADLFGSDKMLIGMLLDLADLGRLHVLRPTVHFVAEETSSNYEQVFAHLLGGERGLSLTGQLEVIDGTVVVDDVSTGRQFRIEGIALDATLGSPQQGITLAGSGTLPGQRETASFKIDLTTSAASAEGAAFASGKIDCETTALPLELLEPILRRRFARAQMTGRLSTKLTGAWGALAAEGSSSVRGEASVTDLVCSAAALGDDQIRIERLDIPCHIVQDGDTLKIEQLEITCDLGQLALTGAAQMSDLAASDRLPLLLRDEFDLKGELDLARLAGLLPGTLRIRQGTEITSGNVTLAVSSREGSDKHTWSGHLDASHLKAVADGREVSWDKPLSLQFVTHDAKTGLFVDRAQCTSSFLQITATGSMDELTASARFDLARLMAELRKFSDLNHVQLAGSAAADLAWKRVDKDGFSAEGNLETRGFQFVSAGGRPWKEDQVLARFSASGQFDGQTIKRIDEAACTLEANGERMQLQLVEAVSDPAREVVPLEFDWQGQLGHWAPRLESCLGIAGWNAAGAGKAQGLIQVSGNVVEFKRLQADVAQFQLVGHDWHVREPAVAASLSGNLNLAKNRLEIVAGKLTAGETVAVFDHAVVQDTVAGWTLDGGTAEIAAPLGQLYQWRHDPRTISAWQADGQLTGKAELKHQQGVTSGRVEASIDQLEIIDLAHPSAGGSRPASWEEPQVTLVAVGNFQHATEMLQLDKLQIASDALRCDAQGTLPTSEQGGNIDLRGKIQYDWDRLAPLWRPFVGQHVQIAGQQTRDFAIHGRVTGDPMQSQSWQQVTGEADIGWNSITAHGVQVSRGEVAANLTNGQVRIQPLDVQISGGRLTTSPVVQLSPGPAEIFLNRGPLATDVHLTPEMCARGLHYVMPILSGTTVAEGRFSVELDGGRLPLADPESGDISGRLTVQAQAKPGPIAKQFGALLGELGTILKQGTFTRLSDHSGAVLTIDEANIEFRVVNRRVYHRGLKFTIGGMPVTTYGSVGFDETLAIVAELPLEAKLLGQDLSLGTLNGKTIQIPIDGTLSKPKLDRREMEHLTGEMLQNTTKSLFIDGAKKQLERLLPIQQ